MRARILAETEIADYEVFLEGAKLGTLTQSSVWGHFQQEVRGKTWRVVVEDEERGGQIVAACLIVKHSLPKGLCWLYSQGGPVGDFEVMGAGAGMGSGGDWFEVLKVAVRDLAQREKALFWRISPLLKLGGPQASLRGFQKAHAHYQPESTLMINLEQSEEEILATMKQKGRYNIRVAAKKGVAVRFSNGKDGDLERFYKLMQKTTSRNGFHAHDFEYYMKMMKELGASGNVELALAEAEGELLAGAIITYYGEMATYYYGASNNIKRNYMAPYLLQWEMIKRSKNRGFKKYDFLGISPEGASEKHPWQKVTEFKLKLGGERVNYLPEQELIYRPLVFGAMRMVKSVRSLFKR